MTANTDPTDAERVAVFDFLFDFAEEFPQHRTDRGGFFVKVDAFKQAHRSIPDEFHAPASFGAAERFVRSIVNEARARNVDPFNAAEFAFDLVPA